MTNFEEYEKQAALLKALAHPVRLCIVKGLLESGCNVSKMQECLGVPQSTVSQHLAKLRAAGVIRGERRGTEICYSVEDETARQVIGLLFGPLEK